MRTIVAFVVATQRSVKAAQNLIYRREPLQTGRRISASACPAARFKDRRFRNKIKWLTDEKFDSFLYTSLWDGLPNILLEAGERRLPNHRADGRRHRRTRDVANGLACQKSERCDSLFVTACGRFYLSSTPVRANVVRMRCAAS